MGEKHQRFRRAGTFTEEWTKRSDHKRECVEEKCNVEEYLEAAENFNQKERFPVDTSLFETYYKTCYEAVVANGLADPQRADLWGFCLSNFEKKKQQNVKCQRMAKHKWL